MENLTSESQSVLELQIDAASGDYIESAGWWAKFSSVVIAILIFLVVIVFGYLYYLGAGYTTQLNLPFADSVSAVLLVAIIFVVAFCGLMIALLVMFANRVKKGVEQLDQDQLERGFNALKIYFIIYGILSFIGLLGTLISFAK